MELEVYETLQAEAPHFDLLPDLVFAYIAAQVHLNRPRIALMTSGRCNDIARIRSDRLD